MQFSWEGLALYGLWSTSPDNDNRNVFPIMRVRKFNVIAISEGIASASEIGAANISRSLKDKSNENTIFKVQSPTFTHYKQWPWNCCHLHIGPQPLLPKFSISNLPWKRRMVNKNHGQFALIYEMFQRNLQFAGLSTNDETLSWDHMPSMPVYGLNVPFSFTWYSETTQIRNRNHLNLRVLGSHAKEVARGSSTHILDLWKLNYNYWSNFEVSAVIA
jgi:hypothetical protein